VVIDRGAKPLADFEYLLLLIPKLLMASFVADAEIDSTSQWYEFMLASRCKPSEQFSSAHGMTVSTMISSGHTLFYVMSKQMYYQIPIIHDEQTWFDYLNTPRMHILCILSRSCERAS
jgi:hypothetical protein